MLIPNIKLINMVNLLQFPKLDTKEIKFMFLRINKVQQINNIILQMDNINIFLKQFQAL